MCKTLVQIFVIWGFFLWAVPAVIRLAESAIGIPTFAPQETLGCILFVAFSALGLSSAAIFAIWGKGTPLPLDTATRLVVIGPYRVVRNPMAVAGIGQGLSIGLVFGSALVMIYSLLGAVLWHLFARPWEERDLSKRFGEAYDRYRAAVPLWLPRLSAYPRIEAVHSELEASN